MAASIQCRPQERTLGMVMKQVDEDLAMFLQLRHSEKERNDLIAIHKDEEYLDPHGTGSERYITATMPMLLQQKNDTDVVFDPKNCKTDYGWLVTLPDNPVISSEDMEPQKPVEAADGSADNESAPQDSDALKSPQKCPSQSNTSTKQAESTKVTSSAAAKRGSSSSGGRKSSNSRAPTPTSRPQLQTVSKSSRPSTPTSRATLASSKSTAPQVRSSTPTRSTSRPSTPTAVPSTGPSKSASRSGTPKGGISNQSNLTSKSISSGGPSSLKKADLMSLKDPVKSRGTSPMVKSRTQECSEMSKSSQDGPPSVSSSMPKRPASASRVRPTAPSAKSCSTKANRDEKPRRQSCSPARGRTQLVAAYSGGNTLLSRSRGHTNTGDDVNPVLMGTKMVERVVNMRKLVPPKKDDHLYTDNSTKKASSSQDSAGFGRSFSKKSLDMAMRHMDIRRSINGNL